MRPASPARRVLSACVTLAVLVLSSTTESIAATTPSSRPEPMSAYLFVHFTGESVRGEQTS